MRKKLSKTVTISVVVDVLSISRNVKDKAAYFGVSTELHISGVFETFKRQDEEGIV